MKQRFLVIALIMASITSFGQIYTSFYNFEHVNQNLLINPANPHPYRFVIGLPGASGISVHVNNSIFRAGNILNDNTLNENIEEIIANMPDRGRLNFYENVDLVYAGFGLKHGYVSFGIQQEATLNTIIPKQLLSFLYYGNVNNPDNGINFQAKDFNTEALIQVNYHIGYQHYLLDSALIVGGRFKYISGTGHAHFQRFNAELQADFFEWKVNTDILIETSGYQYIDNFEFNPLELFNSGNNGYGIDLGATYLLPKMKISASVLNIGSITWKQDLKMYQSQGSFTYDGAFVDENNQELSFDDVLDSLEAELGFKEITPYSYKTKLPMHIMASYEYQVHPKHAFALTYQGSVWSGSLYNNFGINYIGRYARRFNLLVGYSRLAGGLNNVALGLSAAAGPVQLYLMCDNVYGAVNIRDLSSTSVRFGINLAFLDIINKKEEPKTEESTTN